MPRDTITVTEITQAGIAPPAQVTGVAANDLQFVAELEARMFMEVENVGAGSLDVTIETALTINGLALADQVVTVPAGAKRLVRLVWDRFNTFVQSDGKVYVNITADTDLKFRVYKV